MLPIAFAISPIIGTVLKAAAAVSFVMLTVRATNNAYSKFTKRKEGGDDCCIGNSTCQACNGLNAIDAKFCSECGAQIVNTNISADNEEGDARSKIEATAESPTNNKEISDIASAYVPLLGGLLQNKG